MRLHKKVYSCKLYRNQNNCNNDGRCNWSDKTNPNCKSKQKNVWTVRVPKSKTTVRVSSPKGKSKVSDPKCDKDQIINPTTGRCVKKSGKIGKAILASKSSQ